MTVDAEQRSRLLRMKLAALVRELEVDVSAEPVSVGAITAVVADGHVLALAEVGGPAVLASALVWANRQGATALTLFVDDLAEDVARWASYFALGDRRIDVRAVIGAKSESAHPSPLPILAERSTEYTSDEAALVDQLLASGVEVVDEHGVVRGEVLGLEVARLVRWSSEHGGDDALHLEAGVGRFDRDAAAAAHPDEPPAVGLARTVDSVRKYRYSGAPVHPIQMLARERWLRALVLADPTLVGASELVAVAMTTESTGLRDTHPAAAFGTDTAGRPLLVVCSTGVDLALVPLAADTRALIDPDARLLLTLPERDHHAATIMLAQMLLQPAELVAVPPGWS